MPLIAPDGANAVMFTDIAVDKLMYGGVEIWTAPVPVIADFYGASAPGDVVQDLRFDDTGVAAGDPVSAVRNDGGAGAWFSLSAVAGEEPTAGVSRIGFDDQYDRMSFANAADLNGVHIFIPIRPRTASGSNRFPRLLSHSASSNLFLLNLVDGAVGTRAASGPLANVTLSVGSFPLGVWHLLEVRYAGGALQIFRHGALVASQTGLQQATFPLDIIAGNVGNLWLNGEVGRTVAMIANPSGRGRVAGHPSGVGGTIRDHAVMTALRRLIDIIATPSLPDEDGYQWALIGIGHVMLGAALQGAVGAAGAVARLMITVAYWLAKERGDLKRGGSWRDGLIDAALVGFGAFYDGPRWWPVAAMVAICIGAVLKERRGQ